MNIVFHGGNAASFSGHFQTMLDESHTITLLPDRPQTAEHQAAFSAAEVMITSWFSAGLPPVAGLRLLHVTGAGYDSVDFAVLPARASVCNCYGHEPAISEYVMAALLAR